MSHTCIQNECHLCKLSGKPETSIIATLVWHVINRTTTTKGGASLLLLISYYYYFLSFTHINSIEWRYVVEPRKRNCVPSPSCLKINYTCHQGPVRFIPWSRKGGAKTLPPKRRVCKKQSTNNWWSWKTTKRTMTVHIPV